MEQRIQKAYASAPKTWLWQLLAAFIVACLLAWSGTAVQTSNPTSNGLEVAGNIISGIFHPSAKLLFTLGTNGVPYLLLETFCIAFLGTIVGAVISLPLSFISASNLVPKPLALVGRILIAAIRTVPAFVYGLMFIRVTGPGPFAGLLTMSLCSIGMVSKMFIESIEDLDKRILESLDAAGCTTFQKIRYGVIPQLTASFISTTIYRFDINLKDATTLGIVGAGGIGVKLNEALGLFKYIAVADVLNMVVDTVFPHYADYSAPMLILTAVMYTFYLYFSFSGYSEISRATGLVLGLDLPENFKTPFYATNFSGFWSRWHISFSSWLQDYLFMPLAWADLGRFGRLPTELCVFCVFFASGFWHGSTAPFIIWGLLQAVYRVGEELLHRRFGKPKKRGTPARVLWGKRVVVFVLWTISMVFFRVGSGNLSGMAENLGVGDAFVYLGRCLMNSWSPARFAGELYSTAYTGFYANTIMVAAYWAFAALALALGIWLDHRRNFACKNKPAEVALASAKHRNALYVVLIVFILVGYIMQSGGFNANAFGPYAGF